jgi:hypothetical protein
LLVCRAAPKNYWGIAVELQEGSLSRNSPFPARAMVCTQEFSIFKWRLVLFCQVLQL